MCFFCGHFKAVSYTHLFSEDTYRTLMAADSAVMVIDAAKGVENQTKKLFKVCLLYTSRCV